MEGIVTFGEDWLNFYFQSSTSLEILSELLHSMNEMYDSVDFPSITQTPAFANGMPCAAKYAKDNRWYRARLVDVSYNLVYFVDYGNRQMTNLDNVKPLTRTLAELVPPLALPCKIANFQNPYLPSCVSDASLIKIIVYSKTEPFEVSVQIVNQRNNTTQRQINQRTYSNNYRGNNNMMTNGDSNAPGASSSALTNGFHPGGAANRATSSGLTLPPPRPRNFEGGDDSDDEISRAKRQSGASASGRSLPAPRMVRMNNSVSVVGVTGAVSQIYATCGQISGDGIHKHNEFNFNSQETTMRNGPLCVDNLCRLFHIRDRLLFHARFEPPVPGAFVPKSSKPPNGFYQITDVQTPEDSSLLICHAVVTYTSDVGAVLYVRHTQETVFAPMSAFPERIVQKKSNASDFIELGRTVAVRAVHADKFPDLQISAEWLAQSVELLGQVVESQGYMYFVRDNYSVIITEGGLGFGYVYTQNDFVEPNGISMEQWYGTRALFRACVDAPDKDRFGQRWKALMVRLLPEQGKGSYRYAGIFRPSSHHMTDRGGYFRSGGAATATAAITRKAKEFDEHDSEDNFELPEETLAEMRMIGKDLAGIDVLRDSAVVALAPKKADLENLLNESEDPSLLALAQSGIANGTAIQHEQPHALTNGYPEIALASELTPDQIAIVPHDELVTATANVAQRGELNETNIADLLGLDVDDLCLQPVSIYRRPAATAAAASAAPRSNALLDLWEGEFDNPPPQIGNTTDQLGPPTTAAPLSDMSFATSVRFKEAACQTSSAEKPCGDAQDENLLKSEMLALRSSPQSMAKVVAHVMTLDQTMQLKFFPMLANLQ